MARLQNQYIFNEILDRLSGLASNIKLRASFNLLDSNVLSEDFYLGLLNLVYGWNLHNANSDVQNVQGIDLIDRNRKIVVQVTSTCTKQKLEHSLDKIPESCKGFHFYFLPIVDEEKKLRKGKYNPPFDVIFNPQSDILDNATILAKIKEEVNPDKLDAIYAYIRGCIQDGNPTPLVLASGLEYVITQIADSEIEEQEFDVTNFAIPAKVSFNNLSSTGKEVIETYKQYYLSVQAIYEEYAKMGQMKSKAVLQKLHKIYVGLKHKHIGDALFEAIQKEIVRQLSMKNLADRQFTREQLEMCVDILMVHAFIECKIFEKPL